MSSVQLQPLPPTAFASPGAPDASAPPAGGNAGQSTVPQTGADGVRASWAMRAIPAPVPGYCPPAPCDGNPVPGQGNTAGGGFLGLIDKLVSQLGTMIGNMMGDGSSATDTGSAASGSGVQTLATLFGGTSGGTADPVQSATSMLQPIAFD